MYDNLWSCPYNDISEPFHSLPLISKEWAVKGNILGSYCAMFWGTARMVAALECLLVQELKRNRPSLNDIL